MFLKFCCFITSMSFFIFISCSKGSRPDIGDFKTDISGRSILKKADVVITESDGEKSFTAKTDEEGFFEVAVDIIGNVEVEVCGGKYLTSDDEISFSGCLKNSFEVEDKKQYSVVVDFISTFISSYESDTDRQEWYDYLDISGSIFPEEENSLTDSAKAWLFTQGLIKTAQDASDIDSAGETLLEKLLDDLKDNNTIDGSTDETIGSISVGENIFRKMIPQSIEKLYDSDKTADWREHLETADADFLGAESESEEKSISIKIYQGESGTTEADCYHETITVKATAENFSTVRNFSCIHEEIGSLTDENDADKHFEAVVDISELENGSYTVSCGLTDGSQLYDEEKTYTVDNNAPEISISIYKEGTKEETGTEESPARGSVDMVAQASHKNYEIEDLYCIIDEKSLTDTEDAKDKVKSTVDTTTFPEGENTVICTALVNSTQYNAQSALYIENRTDVTIKPFIAHSLIPTNDTKVTYSDSEGNESVAEIEDNNITASLQLGKTYTVDVMNGQYRSVTLSEDESDLKTYSGRLSARVTVSEDTSEVIVTPMTSISQRLYESILEHAPSRDAEAESISLIEGHYGSGQLNLTTVPNNNKTNDMSTRAFIAGAAFEELAYYISTVELDTDPGTIPVSQIMNIFYDELENDVLLDGFNDTSSLAITDGDKVFPIDSYLYRKFYAIAIKNFLNSDRNPTTLNALQSMVNNTAENDSILFPDDKPPVPVNLDGPEVEISEFQVLWNNEKVQDEWQETETYDPENQSIPVFNHGFKITFSVTPDAEENQILDVDFTDISAPKDNDVFDIIRIEPQSADDFTQSTVEYVYEIVPSEGAEAVDVSNLDFSITVTDTAYNETTALIQTVWDGMPPQVGVVVPDNPVQPADGDFSWNITENHFLLSSYQIENVSTGQTSALFNVDTQSDTRNIASFVDTVPAEDREGDYTVTVTATDTAGNIGSGEGVITVDTTPPTFSFEFRNEDGKKLEDKEADNKSEYEVVLEKEEIEETVFFSSELYSSNGYDSFKDFTLHSETPVHKYSGIHDEGEYSLKVFARDLAGNVSDTEEISFVIDKTAPQIIEDSIDFNNNSHPTGWNNMPLFLWICAHQNGPEEDLISYGAPGIWFNVEDNYFSEHELSVKVRNINGGNWQNCLYKDIEDDPCGPFFVCSSLEGEDGPNTYEFSTVDPLENESSFTKQITLDLEGPGMPEITLSDKHLNSEQSGGIDINWTDGENADSHSCKIYKIVKDYFTGATSREEIATCANNSTITAGDISADFSADYEIDVRAINSNGATTATESFKYFNFDQLTFEISSDWRKDVETEISGSAGYYEPNIKIKTLGKAPIDSVSIYLSGHYEFGNLQSSGDFEICKRDYNDTTGIEGTFKSCDFPSGFTGGRYDTLKVKAVIDGITKWKTVSNNSCVLDNNDKNNAFDADVSYDEETASCYAFKSGGEPQYFGYKLSNENISSYSITYRPYKCISNFSNSSVDLHFNYPDKMSCGSDEYFYSKNPEVDKNVSFNNSTKKVTVTVDFIEHGRAGAAYIHKLHENTTLGQHRHPYQYTIELPDPEMIKSCDYHFKHQDLSSWDCKTSAGAYLDFVSSSSPPWSCYDYEYLNLDNGEGNCHP
ncbi:MAG: hypothetical protein R6W70_07660 [bacterium]